MSKLKPNAECLECFLDRKLVGNKIIFSMYIDRIVWLIVQNNKREISDYTSHISPSLHPSTTIIYLEFVRVLF
jgi:hypothetical protein